MQGASSQQQALWQSTLCQKGEKGSQDSSLAQKYLLNLQSSCEHLLQNTDCSLAPPVPLHLATLLSFRDESDFQVKPKRSLFSLPLASPLPRSVFFTATYLKQNLKMKRDALKPWQQTAASHAVSVHWHGRKSRETFLPGEPARAYMLCSISEP